MRFVKTILILSLGCLTLAEETNMSEFANFAKDIKKFMDQYLPQLQSRMFETKDDDAMVLSYIIANATKDILMNSKKTNDDDYVKNIITETKTGEIPQEVNYVTKDPTDEENKKMLAPKAIIEDEYTEVIRKKKKDIDSDTETSYFLQNLELPSSSVDTPKKEIDSDTETSSLLQSAVNQMPSSEDSQIKDTPLSVALYVMGRDGV